MAKIGLFNIFGPGTLGSRWHKWVSHMHDQIFFLLLIGLGSDVNKPPSVSFLLVVYFNSNGTSQLCDVSTEINKSIESTIYVIVIEVGPNMAVGVCPAIYWIILPITHHTIFLPKKTTRCQDALCQKSWKCLNFRALYLFYITLRICLSVDVAFNIHSSF